MSVLFGVLHKHEQKTFYPHETCKELKKNQCEQKSKIQSTFSENLKNQEFQSIIIIRYFID